MNTRRVVFDIEADGLDPTLIWCLVAYDIDTGELFKFTRPDTHNKKRFLRFAAEVKTWIAHNAIGYDCKAVNKFISRGLMHPDNVQDTLVMSWLDEFNRPGGHSLANWGEKMELPKGEYKDFSRFTFEMLEYCVQDVRVTVEVYKRLAPKMKDLGAALELEHQIAWILEEVHENGFAFDEPRAREVQREIASTLETVDASVLAAFPPLSVPSEVRSTKSKRDGSLSKVGLSWYQGNVEKDFTPDTEYCILEYEAFNPASPKQIVERLHSAGWRPTEKTKTHLEWERKRPKTKEESDLRKAKLEHFQKFGWKVNEANLATLPDTAPEGARLLVKRIFYASRLRTLEEWFEAYEQRKDGRIHGRIQTIGAWTHRCSHKEPNTGNIAAEKSLKYTSREMSELAKHYGKELRSLWRASDGTVLVGTDADGIQLRILAHYMEDEDFIEALVNGRKEDGTDAHSVNQRIIGPDCKTRDNSKTFIYAYILGAGNGKLAEILGGIHRNRAIEARDRFTNAWPGLKKLKEERIPEDARRGYFIGVDGRPVACDSEHHMLAGYLQNGEATIMKRAMLIWGKSFAEYGIPYKLVNFIHDEWQTEVPDMPMLPECAGWLQAKAIEQAGVDLGLLCPLKGNFNIGHNWYETH